MLLLVTHDRLELLGLNDDRKLDRICCRGGLQVPRWRW